MHTGRLPGNRQEDKGGNKTTQGKVSEGLDDSGAAHLRSLSLPGITGNYKQTHEVTDVIFTFDSIKHRPRFSNSIPSARTSSAADRPNRPAKVNLPSKVNYRVINDTLAAKQ